MITVFKGVLQDKLFNTTLKFNAVYYLKTCIVKIIYSYACMVYVPFIKSQTIRRRSLLRRRLVARYCVII